MDFFKCGDCKELKQLLSKVSSLAVSGPKFQARALNGWMHIISVVLQMFRSAMIWAKMCRNGLHALSRKVESTVCGEKKFPTMYQR